MPPAVLFCYYAYPNLWSDLNEATATPEVDAGPTAKEEAEDAEDHIPASALRALADGHSFELRKAAFKTVLNQSLKGETRKLLLKDLASRSPKAREDAVLALHYIINGPDPNDSENESARCKNRLLLQDLAVYQAIVTALCNLLPLHLHATTDVTPSISHHDISPIKPLRRPPTEAQLVSILIELIRAHHYSPKLTALGGIRTALEAGLIKRWLSKYPFPCTLPEFAHFNLRRSDLTELLTTSKDYSGDDDIMTSLFRELQISSEAQRQLQTAGLAKRQSRLTEEFEDEDPVFRRLRARRDEWNAPVSARNRNVHTPPSVHAVPFPNEDFVNEIRERTAAWRSFHPPGQGRSALELARGESSGEEIELRRRRHREAVVLSEPIDPLDMVGLFPRIRRPDHRAAMQVHMAQVDGASAADVEHVGDVDDVDEGEADDDDQGSVASWLTFSDVGGDNGDRGDEEAAE